MSVASKTAHKPIKLSPAKIRRVIETEVTGSLRRLQIEVLPVCLMHSEVNFRHIEVFLKLQEKGLIEHVGYPITDISKARGIYRSGRVDMMQVPLNILDRRLTNPRAGGLNFLDKATSRGVALFARSAYLQDLIVMDPQKFPRRYRQLYPH